MEKEAKGVKSEYRVYRTKLVDGKLIYPMFICVVIQIFIVEYLVAMGVDVYILDLDDIMIEVHEKLIFKMRQRKLSEKKNVVEFSLIHS